MKTALKLMALILCLLMLVPCIAACAGDSGEETDTAAADNGTGNNGTGNNGTGNGESNGGNGDASTPDGSNPAGGTGNPGGSTGGTDDTGEKGLYTYEDLGGYTYKAYVRSKESGNGGFLCEDFWVESYSTDPLSYAVYTRNKDIEDEYNCRIRQVDSTTKTQYDEMKTFYLNGDTYELGVVLALGAASCATSNLLKDIYTLDNIKLDNATYDDNSVEQFTMGGKLYYFSGDMNISPLDCAAVTVFNIEEHSLLDWEEALGKAEYNDLYGMVREGKWTVDAMLEMADKYSIDNDNSGGSLDATLGDHVGYFQYSASAQYYWYGCGARTSRLADIEEGGYPEIVYDEAHENEVFEFLYSKLNTAVENPDMPVGASGTRLSNYSTGHVLFTDLLLWDIRKSLHPKELSYGILPIPKYNEAQERYYNVVYYQSSTAHLWMVPTMCSNEEYASFLLNAIAVYSARPDNTMDAYYTKTLELTVAQDAGSRATLKIVRDTVTYDICILYDWGKFITGTVGGIATATSNRYGDATAQDQLDVAEEEMNKTLQGFKEPALPETEE